MTTAGRLPKTHALNRTFRPEWTTPDDSLCGLMDHQVRAHANHTGPFGVDCKRCLAMLRWLKVSAREMKP